jgi:hypothetical protein
MNSSNTTSPLLAWFLWILVNTAAAALAIGAVFLAIMIPGFNEDRLAGIVGPPVFFLLITLGQLAVLKWCEVNISAWRWLGANALGILIAIGAISLASRIIPADQVDERFSTVALGLYGLGLGLGEWWALRRKLDRAWLWFFTSFAGGIALGLLTGDSFSSLWELILIGVIPATLTGMALAIGLQRQVPPLAGQPAEGAPGQAGPAS